MSAEFTCPFRRGISVSAVAVKCVAPQSIRASAEYAHLSISSYLCRRILYGSEFQYGFDAAGRNVRDSVVRVGDIKGARPDSTATIMLAHDEAPGIPTVGEVLFIRLYTKYFAHVYVRTRDWVSELYKGPPEMAWIHALREDKSKQGQ